MRYGLPSTLRRHVLIIFLEGLGIHLETRREKNHA